VINLQINVESIKAGRKARKCHPGVGGEKEGVRIGAILYIIYLIEFKGAESGGRGGHTNNPDRARKSPLAVLLA
jgi:hypothetical protein